MDFDKNIKKKVTKNISFDSLEGVEKAAILLNYLGTGSAKKLFNHIEDRDIKKLLEAMGRLKVVPVRITKQVLKEFYGMISESESYIFSNVSRKMVVDVVGEDRACGILSHSTYGLDSLETIDISSLSSFLLNEHPQTIAVVLAHLGVEKKGEVLQRLPEDLQSEVVLRLSRLNRVAPELVSELEQVLKKELSIKGASESVICGGVQSVADMLNVVDEKVEAEILSRVEERDPLLADEIRTFMFLFEDLVKVNDRGIQILLREVPNNQLLLALKTASDGVKKKIFKNISQRATQLLKEDLENMGPSRLSDVERAQAEIINIAKQLEQADEIFVVRAGARNVAV